MAGAQFVDIVVSAADGDFARMVETVAERLVAAQNAINLARHDILPEQCDNALQRTHPAQRFCRDRRRAPALRFGPWESAHNGRNGLCQHFGCRTAGFFNHGKINTVAFDQLVLRQADLAQEALHRLRRRANLGALGLFRHCLGFEWQPLCNQCQATRGRVGDDLGSLQARLVEFGAEQARKVIARLILHARRNFLAAQFKKEVGHSTHPFLCIHASQLPLARSRTRPI